MKKTLIILIFAFFLSSCSNQTDNKAFYPGQQWLDNNDIHINAHGGGILFHKDKYYWYGEHKVEGDLGNSAQVGVHVYSSSNLYNWTDEGIALKVNETDTTSNITKGCVLERPKVIFNKKTQKFVMWFHLELKGKGYDAAQAGVAISASPVGPFKYIESNRSNAGFWPLNVQDFHKSPVANTVKDKYCGGKECLPNHVDSLNILGRDFTNGQMSRDMNLFVDDDGKAYHLYSSEENSTIHISQLSDDYLRHTGNYVRIFVGRYMEAATILKNSDGKYFFIGSDCTGWAPNTARLASANHIFGPWSELGNPSVGKGSLTTFDSQSTFMLPVQGENDAFIFMADRWTPENPINGKYIWLPIKFVNNKITLEWKDKWDLSVFD